MSTDPLVRVRGLEKHYSLTKGVMRKEIGRVKAVDGISFDVDRGETVGLVGESGCGKSTAATTLLQLEEPTGGEVLFDGEDITEYDKKELKRFRRRAQMIFQNPDESFDPRMSIGQSVGEPLKIHGIHDLNRRREIVKDLLERVGLSADDINRYPHEFSGGQKQRIALARALSVNPDLIVADEPASALDVSIQAQILDLMQELQDEFGLAILFISHNLGVIRDICDRVAVMYLGEIVEIGPVEQIFSDPQHPYTRALLKSIPSPDPRKRGESANLTGTVPSPTNPPAGCRFHTRCPEVIQPEDYDFDQEAWRGVMDLRVRLQNRRLDLESIRELAATRFDLEEPEDATDRQIRAEVRNEFDIPDSLSDEAAERVLSSALDHIADERIGEASELLAEEFETVCDQVPPELESTEAGHEASCHLLSEVPPAQANRAASDRAASSDD